MNRSKAILSVAILTFLCSTFVLAFGSHQQQKREERVFVERFLRQDLSFSNAHVSAPSNWLLLDRAESETPLKLTFALKHRNVEHMEKLLKTVSDPLNPFYGEHLSFEEIGERFGPSKGSVDAVTRWIKTVARESKVSISQNREFLTVITSVESAEKLLGCDFHVFEHKDYESARLHRCTSMYSLPKSIASLVDFVGGVIRFPRIDSIQINRRAEAGLAVTPNLIHKQYKTKGVYGTNPKNKQGVAQFLNQYYSPGDLEEFFTLFAHDMKGSKPIVVGPNSGAPGTEASLDIEYIMGVGKNVTSYFWSVEDPQANQEPFLDWILQVHNTSDPPQVFSVSYGDEEPSLTDAYVHRVSQEFQKAGLRGISILFASGDSGVGGRSFGCSRFVPDFPASSPYVTAVGGTRLGLLETGPETVNSLSGGGFSDFFARPSYQEDAVDEYFKVADNLPPASKFNRSSRGYPDVSALSSGFVVVVDRIPMPGVAGTSCAAPTFGGVVALLNDLRLNADKSPLGFLNPFIYKMAKKYPEAFTDVTKGSNPGCGTDGFHAAKGWDPASGWGSPNYEILSKIVLQY